MSKPTHVLKIKARDPSDNTTNTVGVLWENKDGSLSLRLKYGVTLSWRDQFDYILTIFDNSDQEEGKS